jgi:hypothetical protein
MSDAPTVMRHEDSASPFVEAEERKHESTDAGDALH